MDLPEETITDLQRRLRRAEGQDCRAVVTQLSAVTKALEQAGFLLVAAGMQYCLTNPEASRAEGLDLDEIQRMFRKLA